MTAYGSCLLFNIDDAALRGRFSRFSLMRRLVGFVILAVGVPALGIALVAIARS